MSDYYSDALQQHAFPTAADLSAAQGCFVALDSTGSLALPAAGADALGILNQKPSAGAGQAGVVTLSGIEIVIYGGTVAAGDDLMSDASGHAVKATAGAVIVAKALAAGAAGESHATLLRVKSAGSESFHTLTLPVDLASVAAGAIAAITLPFAGKVVSAQFSVSKPTSTAAKAATLTPAIQGVATTGGAMALTTANTNANGDNVAGTPITGNNSFTAGQTVGLLATGVTAFVEGQGYVVLVVSE